MSDQGRILIVDDDPRNISRIEQALEAIGRESVSACDEAQALAALSRLSGPHGFPGAVITDMKMPVMDGLEFLERARAIDGDLPVIVITAYGDVASAVKAMKNGAYDFIERPFEAEVLRTGVLRALEKRDLVLEPERMDAVESTFIRAAPADHAGNVQATADALGIPRRTLNEKMRKHGLDRKEFL
jgi:two-component system C4-dicarboxylate transport response regulator DctD